MEVNGSDGGSSGGGGKEFLNVYVGQYGHADERPETY